MIFPVTNDRQEAIGKSITSVVAQYRDGTTNIGK